MNTQEKALAIAQRAVNTGITHTTILTLLIDLDKRHDIWLGVDQHQLESKKRKHGTFYSRQIRRICKRRGCCGQRKHRRFDDK